jgi:hypothetical protein
MSRCDVAALGDGELAVLRAGSPADRRQQKGDMVAYVVFDQNFAFDPRRATLKHRSPGFAGLPRGPFEFVRRISGEMTKELGEVMLL